MTVDSPRHDCAVQTTTTTGLALLIGDDAYKSATPPEWPRKSRSRETRARSADGTTRDMDVPRRSGKSNAIRRHFAQYERQDEMNDEIELGWDCGIW
jgi:hypothetical protein